MADAGTFQTTTQTVGAGQVQQVSITGSYLACIAASESYFGIRLDNAVSAQFAQGLKVRCSPGQQFSSVWIDNTAGAGPLTVTLAYGSGDLVDSRFIDVTPNLQSLLTQADVACAPGAQTELIGVDTNRQAVIVCNPIANPREVRVGDANTGAAQGYELSPGDSVTLATTQPVYVWNPHTAAMPVAAMSVEA